MKFGASEIKRKIKFSLYFLLFYSGVFHLFFTLYVKMKKRSYPVVILFYHRFKEGNEATVLAKLWIKSFEHQMLYLKKWYNVISLDTLIERIKNKEDFSCPTVVITIDDGFRDNYDLAYPILKDLDLPATIYLTSGYIDTLEAPWVDVIGTALNETKRDMLSCPELFGDQDIAISTHARKAELLHGIYKKLLYLEHDHKVGLVNQVLRSLRQGSNPETRERAMLNWEEIREMSQHGISFGAHTVTHPTLSRMDIEEAKAEIIESKQIIEKELGRKAHHFAIPNGQNEDFTESLRDFCRQGLFESVVSTNYGCVTTSSDPYNLPRVCFDGPLYYFVLELARLMLVKG